MGDDVGVDRAQANVLAGRICAAAGLSAQSECELLELIGEFDATNAVRWWLDVKSLAHWLSWCCSMTPGTAREHVRVAKALRVMPTVTTAFREGRLSYSKVREVTRVVGVLDEAELCELALTATASQLARMLASYRSTSGFRIRAERERALSWTERDDQLVDFRIRLPKEEAAILIAAIAAAKDQPDQFGTPPPAPCPERASDQHRHADSEPVPTEPVLTEPVPTEPGSPEPVAGSAGSGSVGVGPAGPESVAGSVGVGSAGVGSAGVGSPRPEPVAGSVGVGSPGPGPVAASAETGPAGTGSLAERRAWARARARDRRVVSDGPVDTTPVYGYPDAILDVARVFLDTAPEDRSGEDRTLVVIHVAADQLTGPHHTNEHRVREHCTDEHCTDGYRTDGYRTDGDGVDENRSVVDEGVADGDDKYCTRELCVDVPAGTPARCSDELASGGVDDARVGDAGVCVGDAGADAGAGDAGATDARAADAGVEGDVPAGTFPSPDPSGPSVPAGVPAGTPSKPAAGSFAPDTSPDPDWPDPTCHLQGLGGIEPETARRLACEAYLIGAVVDTHGEVLALGRTRRLVSRAQRRALMIRDGICQFSGCHQIRHLQAHHIVAWSNGGPTDLDNLILLCSFHHTAVHEGGMSIVRTDTPTPAHRWDFTMPDGRPHQDWYDAEALAYLLAQQAPARQAEFQTIIEGVDGFDHPDATRIMPGWSGERFDLHECVQALFRIQLPDNGDEEEWAAA